MASVRGRLEVVNVLRLHDEYLAGIAEVSASWPAAALQAQAIAARSYALSRTKQRSGCRCHVDDGSGPYYDQTFHGYAREISTQGGRWVKAVRDTATGSGDGLAVTYRGDPIPAFYFASSGGRTSNSEDVWGGRYQWARSVDDHWSVQAAKNPDRQWRAVRSHTQLAAAFGLASVAQVVIDSRYVSGAVKTATATSRSGKQATLSGSTLRSRLGLRSTWVTTIS